MLLTIEQAEKLRFLILDHTKKSYFVYDTSREVSKEDIQYAIQMHEKYTHAFGKPFIGNIDILMNKLKEIEG